MKRYLTILAALAVVSVSAGAQDMYYAELLSRNNYYGTARSIALGGAMTALGGDLGSVTYNPAGSAVNDYCQFTVSPGLIISGVTASYDPTGMEAFTGGTKTDQTKFNLPNIGLNLVFFPSHSSWLTSFSFGVVANTANTYLSYSTGRGVNTETSFLGNLANAAGGLSPSNFPLSMTAAYNANQIGEYGPEGSNAYVGANQVLRPDETYSYIPGALDQTSFYNTYGTKTDLVFNLGFNVGDRFYFGFNLGTPQLSYRREESFIERAQQPEAFPVIMYEGDNLVKTEYLNSSNGYKLNTEAQGIYGRFGIIALPTNNLRIGAAIQTPTLLRITERWQYSAAASYGDSYFNGSDIRTSDSYRYNLRTPYIFDAGIAYTVPGVGLLSIDYELTDYSKMKYSETETNYFYEDVWAVTNYVNSLFCGASHSVRAGVEFKPLPFMAIRAGYSFTSDPEKWWKDADGNLVTAETWGGYNQILTESGRFTSDTHSVSFGLGFSTSGSFFADCAVRYTAYPTTYYSPYYFDDYQAFDKSGRLLASLSPIEKINRHVIDTVVTLGWRF